MTCDSIIALTIAANEMRPAARRRHEWDNINDHDNANDDNNDSNNDSGDDGVSGEEREQAMKSNIQ